MYERIHIKNKNCLTFDTFMTWYAVRKERFYYIVRSLLKTSAASFIGAICFTTDTSFFPSFDLLSSLQLFSWSCNLCQLFSYICSFFAFSVGSFYLAPKDFSVLLVKQKAYSCFSIYRALYVPSKNYHRNSLQYFFRLVKNFFVVERDERAIYILGFFFNQVI